MRLFGLLLCALMVAACAAPNPRDGSLYVAMGELDGLDRLTERLLDRVHADDRIALMFDPENREYLHQMIVEQLCDLSGGPCEYSGLAMDEGHAGMQIHHIEFDAFVDDLILSMEDQGIEIRAQNALLAILAPMRADIIDR